MNGPDPHRAAYPAAELDRRFYAYALDRLLIWGLYAAVVFLAVRFLFAEGRVVLGSVGVVAAVVLLWVAQAALLGARGTSPGKALVGLRVVDHQTGRPIGLVPALLRGLILGVAALPTIGLGVATLAWTAVMDAGGWRRGWHDHRTGSVVVDVRPLPAEEAPGVARPRQMVNLTAMRLMTPAQVAAVTARPAAPPAVLPDVVAPAPPTEPVGIRAPVDPPPGSPPPSSPPPSSPPPMNPPPTHRAPTNPPPSSPPPVGPPRHAVPPAESPAAASISQAEDGVTRRREPLAPAAETPAQASQWRVAFDSGEEFDVEGLAIVGRRPEPRPGETVRHVVPLRSSDMSISKTHAQFQVTPQGALVVMDRGSTNGSTIVRQGVSKPLAAGRPATLVDGDIVRFGDRSMTVKRS